MNSMQLKSKLKNIAKEKKIDFNIVLRLYMYDRFIERLAISKYKDNFIIKGGFYLSILFGVENRFTMDVDALFKNNNFNEETIVKMIKKIISLDIKDNARLTFLEIVPIRDLDEYGGFRIVIQIELENIKEKFHIDVVTGDPITPKEISYKYHPILSDHYIHLWAYNIETVLAEKIETILSRLELNGRMRDYYDVYLIYKKEWENINRIHLCNAMNRTFSKREYKGNLADAINVIANSRVLRLRWENYQRKYAYAKEIEFDEIVEIIKKIIEQLELVHI